MQTNIEQKPIEKRKFPRKKCYVNVEYPDDLATHHKAIIRDINQAGAFINTREFLDIGQDILMQVHLPGLPKPMTVIGEIIRHGINGMGVKFNLKFGISAINAFMKSTNGSTTPRTTPHLVS